MFDSIVNAITTSVSTVFDACGAALAALPDAAGVGLGFLGFVGTLLLWAIILIVYVTAIFTLGAVIAILQNSKNNILYAAFVIFDGCATGILLIALIIGLGNHYDFMTVAIQAGMFFVALFATLVLLDRNEMMPQKKEREKESPQASAEEKESPKALEEKKENAPLPPKEEQKAIGAGTLLLDKSSIK